jgi:small subunit ribosomal protein S13
MTHMFGVIMNPKKQLWICLSNIPGVGKKTAKDACQYLGLAPSVRWKDVTENQVRTLSNWLDGLKKPLAMDYRKMRKTRKEWLIALGSYRGIRLRQGLPVRGQNTHSNAQTPRKRLALCLFTLELLL